MNEQEMLRDIELNVSSILADQESINARLATIEKSRETVLSQINSMGEKVEGQDEWLRKIDLALDKIRATALPTGETDALRNALPDDLKAWIPRVEMLSGAGFKSLVDPTTGSVMPRSGAMVRFAQADPIKYVACGGWFQARIKAALAMKEGRPTKAQEWTDRAEHLAKALGGQIGIVSKADLQEDTDAEGGYLVPTVIEAMIGFILKDAAVVRRAGATVIQMTTKTHTLPTLANDFSVAYVSEEGAISDAAPATPFGNGTLTANKQAGIVTVSIELIQDNIINLLDFVMAHLVNLLGRSEDMQALEGTGSPFTGLYSVSGTVSVAGGSNALDKDELLKLIYGGEEQSTIDGGVIFCHPWIMRDAIGLTTGTAGAVFFPFAAMNGLPNNILGVPAFPTAGILRNRGGGTNETTAYHGNPAYIIIGDRMGAIFDVNPYSETEYKKGQIILRYLRRHGIVIWVPGYFTKLTAVTVSA